MARLEVIPGTLAHARELALSIRPEDVLEVAASHGMGPLEGLELSIRHSDEVYAVTVDGQVAAMWGVGDSHLLAGIACIWLVSGQLVEAAPLAFLRRCRVELAKQLRFVPVLTNLVDARYVKAIRWLKWLGFEVCPPAQFGVRGEPFHQIFLRRESWAS